MLFTLGLVGVSYLTSRWVNEGGRVFLIYSFISLGFLFSGFLRRVGVLKIRVFRRCVVSLIYVIYVLRGLWFGIRGGFCFIFLLIGVLVFILL